LRPERALTDLWLAPSTERRTFRPEALPEMPTAARRYLERAIAPGTRLASAVRLRMHGQIHLDGWVPFTAEQVIHRDRGMVWCATALRRGFPLHATERRIDGRSARLWRLLGLLPVAPAPRRDDPRTHVGRLQAESVWLPSLLCEPTLAWTEDTPGCIAAHVALHGAPADLTLAVDGAGRVQAAAVRSEAARFGGVFDREATFGGYTIPTRIRLAGGVGAEGGEFLRAHIDQAIFR
jgi:hypothetical protein